MEGKTAFDERSETSSVFQLQLADLQSYTFWEAHKEQKNKKKTYFFSGWMSKKTCCSFRIIKTNALKLKYAFL